MLGTASRLGPYEIVATLGAGGMGEVYRARDTRLGREVAVKVLPAPFASDPDRLARFEREARAVAALSHPNILAIHDYGTHEATTYAVMELLDGETLRSRLAKGPLPWREAVEIGAAIADGLAAAHAKGIIHRDLKPENLFLTADGRVKVLDFGLARVSPSTDSGPDTAAYSPGDTSPGAVMGTVGYMSPEQVRGLPADAPSDLFSFGCVLYEMVTGRRAFQRDTAAETMTAILHDEPADPTNSGSQLPADLGRLIRQCLAKNPNQRLQSARDLSLGLRTTATDLGLHRPALTRPRSRLRVAIGAALLLIGIVGTSAYFLTRDSKPSDPAQRPEEAKVLQALAVLPFENVGGDPKTEYLSDGIADHLINGLSRVRPNDLKVRPFASVSRYKGQRTDVLAMGRELKVQVIVTGRVRQQADEIALSVEVLDAVEDNRLWGKSYRSRLDAILDLQEQVARDITDNLRLRLTGEEVQRLTKRPTKNPDAYRFYLYGRHFWNKRTDEGFQKGIEHFKAAIERDPAYALAHVGLADSFVLQVTYGLVPPRDGMPMAKAAADRALEIDENSPEAHTTLAFISHRYDWNWSEAERRYRRAIELNPNYPTAHLWYAYFLAERKRFDEAVIESRRAQEIDPLSLMAGATVGWTSYFGRRYDQAIEQLQKTLEMDPNFWVAHDYLGRAYFQKQMYDRAIAEFQKANALSAGAPVIIAELGCSYALAGKKREAQMALEELEELSKRRYVPPFVFAILYSDLGDKDRAFNCLQKAYAARCGVFAYLEAEPMFERLHSDPRVADLLRDVGLTRKTAKQDPSTQSVAVLPFVNVGGDPKTEFLSDGVADQIINGLSQVRRQDLKVRPFTSVARYKGKELDVSTFGRELNVQMIVTGRLQQQGDDLSFHVAVVDVKEDVQLWGHTYRGKRDAILDLQDQIARDVAANLRLGLTGEEEQRLTKRYTADPEAYLLFREGLYHWSKFTPEGIQKAMEYYERAFKKDPNYALAYAGLGQAHLLLGSLHRGPRETHPEAKTYLTKALAIDDTLTDAHSGLGMIHLFHDWDWPAAERELKYAVAPGSSAPANNHYGFYLAAMGRPSDALAYIQRSADVDPLLAYNRNELSMCYNWMRRHDQALAEAKKSLELDPNFPLAYSELGTAYVHKGLPEKAIEELQKAHKSGQSHVRVRGMLGYAYAMAGKKAEARKVLDELKGLSPRSFAFAFPIARLHAALGEKDQAFEWLRKACDERDPHVIWLKVDPTLDNLRSDTRFAQVLKDMGLPP